MRTVILLQDLEFGGCQRQALLLAKGLDRRFGAELWVMTRTEGGVTGEAHSLPVPVRHLTDRPTLDVRGVLPLLRELRNRPADIFMPMTVWPNNWGRILGRLTRTPVIVGTCRGGRSIGDQFETLFNRLAHHHICNSRPLADQLVNSIGIPENRVTVIENGVCPRDDVAGVREKNLVLCVARYVEVKDLEMLLKAFGLVLGTVPDARLQLVGEGELENELRRLADTLGIADSVEFAAPSTDVGPYYDRASVFALSSKAEGTPNVLLEAGAAGLPAVATAVGGVPDVVDDGRTGLLVPPHSAERMAEALCELLSSDEKREAMGDAARARIIERHGCEAMVRHYEQVFDSLIG